MSKLTVEERFWSKVDKSGECWMWTGFIAPNGYGRFSASPFRGGAHRFSWSLANGIIPEGMQIDHICFNKACVRPNHLRAVTVKQNAEHRPGANPGSASGVRGVFWREKGSKWEARVGHNWKVHYLGHFSTKEEAEAAVVAKRLELFTHNTLDRIQG